VDYHHTAGVLYGPPVRERRLAPRLTASGRGDFFQLTQRRIAGMLRSGMSWSAIQAATGCSRATIAKVAKRAA
jgi:hypothetical protein